MAQVTGNRDERNPPPGRARAARLLLPGALFVPVGAELLAPFVFVNFAFPAFFQ
jgi:hypothetical protein